MNQSQPSKRDRDLEREANLFAMELLMPLELVMRDVNSDLSDPFVLKLLCNRYGVPEYWLITRINQVRSSL